MADAIAEKVRSICKNKKNTNVIQEYLTKLEQGTEKEVLRSIPILKGVFSFYAKKGVWIEVELGRHDENGSENSVANKAVNVWLYSSYKVFVELLLGHISSKFDSIKVESLEALMNILQVQHSVLIQSQKQLETPVKLNFPNQFFIKIVKQLMHCANLSKELVECLKNLIDFEDNRYYFLKNIHSLLQQQQQQPSAAMKLESTVIENTHTILSLISKHEKTEEDQKLYIGQLSDHDDLEFDMSEISKSYKNMFSSAWLSLLRLPNVPVVIQKKILIDLDTKIMPQLMDPKLLIDFLTDSYNVGGVMSLLSLNGLFVLINQYNLDYPDFYNKLYNLLEPSIFNAKYEARFFHLLDLFLSSTHLPAYLIASFVKRLSRISLFTPSPDLEMLLVFIRNLLIRHPSSRILVHRKNSKDQDIDKNILCDPYIYEEMDPSKSQALKSCLWELTTLKSHYSSDVLKAVASFKKEFPKLEVDVSQYFDKSYEDIFEAKLKESVDDTPPLNFMRHTEIFKDLDSEMWTLE